MGWVQNLHEGKMEKVDGPHGMQLYAVLVSD